MVVDFLPQRSDLVRVLFPRVDISTPVDSGQYIFRVGQNTVSPSPMLQASAGNVFLIDSFSWRLAPPVSEDSYSGSVIQNPAYTASLATPLSLRLAWAAVQGGGAQSLTSISLVTYFKEFDMRFFAPSPSNEGTNALLVDLSGAIDSALWTPAITPPAELHVRFLFKIYEVKAEALKVAFNRDGTLSRGA